MEIGVIDNCYLKPLTQKQVIEAFGARIDQWRQATGMFRAISDSEHKTRNTMLPTSWPMSSFINPLQPRLLYGVLDSDEKDVSNSFQGLLETTAQRRQISKILQYVSLRRGRSVTEQLEITKQLFERYAQDCVDLDITCVLIPRAANNYTPNEIELGGRYNVDAPEQVAKEKVTRLHWLTICLELSVQFAFFHFKTPYRSQCIQITPQNAQYLGEFLDLFLDPPRNKESVEYHRTYPLSLWSTQDPFHAKKFHFLTPVETDLITDWQRNLSIHAALQMRNDIPVAIYGKKIVLQPESVARLSIACYQDRRDIPLEVQSIEDYLWEFGVDQFQTVAFLKGRKDHDDKIAAQSQRKIAQREEALRGANTQRKTLENEVEQTLDDAEEDERDIEEEQGFYF